MKVLDYQHSKSSPRGQIDFARWINCVALGLAMLTWMAFLICQHSGVIFFSVFLAINLLCPLLILFGFIATLTNFVSRERTNPQNALTLFICLTAAVSFGVEAALCLSHL